MTSSTDFDELIQDALSLPFSGWDFSAVSNRWRSNAPSWDYPALARRHMHGINAMLDQDTGGGELLASLAPFPTHTWATESYPPNIPVAKTRLEPLGVKLISNYSDEAIPLPDDSLDLVLNRHGSYRENELMRLLKPGGRFLTEQVGGDNNIRLNELLQDEVDFMYSCWTLDSITSQLSDAGFEISIAKEEFPLSEFDDIGVLVFYLRIISWQIADFTVDKYRSKLLKIHQDILLNGPLTVSEHRILVEAQKPIG
jgi:SAM-dependent methyltransferase